MSKDNSNDVLGLYELANNVEIIKVNSMMINSYGEKHRSYLDAVKNGKEITAEMREAAGSLNDYLQNTLGHEDKHRGKVLIAEISGVIGHDGDEMAGINLVDLDLSGSRLVNMEFIEQQMDRICLRDCYCENVRFVRCNMSNSDVRGMNIGECEFFGYRKNDAATLLSNIKFSYADTNKVQDAGVFKALEDQATYMTILDNLTDKYRKERQHAIKRSKEEMVKAENGKLSYFDKALNMVAETPFYKQQKVRLTELESQIENEYNAKINAELRNKSGAYTIRFHRPDTDATYVPKESNELASASRLKVKATKQDLMDYMESFKVNPDLSFAQFIHERYAQKISTSGLSAAKIIPDLGGLDLGNIRFIGIFDGTDFSYSSLSNSDLSGVRASGASFEGCNVPDSNFSKAILIDCNMTGIKGEKANFQEVIMLRVRMEAAHLEHGIFNGAFMYSANISNANLASSFMQHTNLDGSIARRVNLSYVDARYARFRKADLTRSICTEINASYADFEQAILNQAALDGGVFKDAIMKEVQAQRASFRQAVMDRVKAQNGNFTEADFSELQSAFRADFTSSIMDKIKAHEANLNDAILTDVRAHQADMTKAHLDRVRAERFDISEGVMDGVRAHSAELTSIIMKKTRSHNADFFHAIMNNANMEEADLYRSTFAEAELENANLKAANAARIDLENAKCKGLQIDDNTILTDANIRDAIDLDPKIIAQRDLQTKMFGAFFGPSVYGHCQNNKDGSNDRLKAQIIGKDVLLAVMGSAGFAFAGGFSAIGAGAGGLGVAGAMKSLSDDMLRRQTSEHHQYIDNLFGDKLAEIGVVAQAAGIKCLKGATYAALAAAIVQSTGLATSGLTTGLGVVGAVTGAVIVADGYKRGSNNEMAVGGVLAASGAVAAAAGGGATATQLSNIAYSAALGAASGAISGANQAIEKLSKGKKPEQVYRDNTKEFSNFIDSLVPNRYKLFAGVVMAVICVALVALSASIFPAIIGSSMFWAATLPVSLSGFAAGYFGQPKVAESLFGKQQEVETAQPDKPGRVNHSVANSREVDHSITAMEASDRKVMNAIESAAHLRSDQPQEIPVIKWTDKHPSKVGAIVVSKSEPVIKQFLADLPEKNYQDKAVADKERQAMEGPSAA